MRLPLGPCHQLRPLVGHDPRLHPSGLFPLYPHHQLPVARFIASSLPNHPLSETTNETKATGHHGHQVFGYGVMQPNRSRQDLGRAV